jgi:hypothetical protein
MTSCIKVGSVVYDLVTTIFESEPTYVNNDMVRMVTKMRTKLCDVILEGPLQLFKA